MIKKLFFFAALAFAVAACNNAGQDGDKEAMTVGELMEQAETLVDQTVMVEGTVTHVCKHGGKRLFITDGMDHEIKVESGENIAQFDATLEGSEVVVEAIVRELRIDEAYLQEWEAELAAEAAETEDTLALADTATMMEEAEEVVEEVAEEVKETAEEAVEEVEEMVEGEEMAEGEMEDHPEMPGKEDHHMDAKEKIAKYREEIAASEKGYIAEYWLEAVSYKEKVAEGEEVIVEEETDEAPAKEAEEAPAEEMQEGKE